MLWHRPNPHADMPPPAAPPRPLELPLVGATAPGSRRLRPHGLRGLGPAAAAAAAALNLVGRAGHWAPGALLWVWVWPVWAVALFCCLAAASVCAPPCFSGVVRLLPPQASFLALLFGELFVSQFLGASCLFGGPAWLSWWPALALGSGYLGVAWAALLGPGSWQHRRGRRRWPPGADLSFLPFLIPFRYSPAPPALQRLCLLDATRRRPPSAAGLSFAAPCSVSAALPCLSPARSPAPASLPSSDSRRSVHSARGPAARLQPLSPSRGELDASASPTAYPNLLALLAAA
jgi:hypothetical protein